MRRSAAPSSAAPAAPAPPAAAEAGAPSGSAARAAGGPRPGAAAKPSSSSSAAPTSATPGGVPPRAGKPSALLARPERPAIKIVTWASACGASLTPLTVQQRMAKQQAEAAAAEAAAQAQALQAAAEAAAERARATAADAGRPAEEENAKPQLKRVVIRERSGPLRGMPPKPAAPPQPGVASAAASAEPAVGLEAKRLKVAAASSPSPVPAPEPAPAQVRPPETPVAPIKPSAAPAAPPASAPRQPPPLTDADSARTKDRCRSQAARVSGKADDEADPAAQHAAHADRPAAVCVLLCRLASLDRDAVDAARARRRPTSELRRLCLLGSNADLGVKGKVTGAVIAARLSARGSVLVVPCVAGPDEAEPAAGEEAAAATEARAEAESDARDAAAVVRALCAKQGWPCASVPGPGGDAGGAAPSQAATCWVWEGRARAAALRRWCAVSRVDTVVVLGGFEAMCCGGAGAPARSPGSASAAALAFPGCTTYLVVAWNSVEDEGWRVAAAAPAAPAAAPPRPEKAGSLTTEAVAAMSEAEVERAFGEVWPRLRDDGWTTQPGTGLVYFVWCLPGVTRKADRIKRVNTFTSKRDVLHYVAKAEAAAQEGGGLPRALVAAGFARVMETDAAVAGVFKPVLYALEMVARLEPSRLGALGSEAGAGRGGGAGAGAPAGDENEGAQRAADADAGGGACGGEAPALRVKLPWSGASAAGAGHPEP